MEQKTLPVAKCAAACVAVAILAAAIFGFIAVSNSPNASETAVSPAQAETVSALTTKTMGDPNAPVTIREFSSLTCGHCGAYHKNTFDKVKEAYIDTGKVYLIYTDFPLNKPALDGSMIAHCMPEERYFSFLSFLFKNQDSWAYSQNDYLKVLRQNSKLAGLSDKAFDECLANKELEEGIVHAMTAAREKWGVQSTPTFVLNDGAEIINGSQSFRVFEEKINKLLAESSTTE